MAETTEELAAGPRRVVVLRHGQTDHNAAGVWQGHLDTHLSERGVAQARAAAAALRAYAPALVVASDLSRAAETGRAVAEAAGAELRLDERLREIHAGAWQGLTGDEVREQYPEDMDRLLTGQDFRRGGTGESVADVAERCAAATADLLASLPAGQTVVVATHGVSGRALAAGLVGIDQSVAWRALGGLGNCHWCVLVEARGGWRIAEWNARAPEANDTSIW